MAGRWLELRSEPCAQVSSFFETVTPLRRLAAYVRLTGDSAARQAVQRAAEVLLSRHLFRRRHDGSVMHPTFVELHYPCYWHYDVLFGLRVLAEASFLGDPRCSDALEYVRSRQLQAGGWPTDAMFWRFSGRPGAGRSLVCWVSLRPEHDRCAGRFPGLRHSRSTTARRTSAMAPDSTAVLTSHER